MNLGGVAVDNEDTIWYFHRQNIMVKMDEVNVDDYKVFVFHGHAHFIQVDYDRFSDHHRNFYDRDWNYMPFTTLYPTNPKHIVEKPQKFNELISMAEKLSEALESPKFLRVDFYIQKEQIFFGEITFYHGSGMEEFFPESYDLKLGELI